MKPSHIFSFRINYSQRFLAGHETSSSALMFALYELALSKDIQSRLRKEINDVTASHDGKITYDSINQMKYLDMVLNETLRKFPVVDVQFRKCASNFKIPKTEMIIPKDASIMVSSYAFHRDERFFEKPDEFDPERFNEENVKKIRPYTFIPFSESAQAMVLSMSSRLNHSPQLLLHSTGEGPRACVGRRFGMMQTKIALAKLLQNFEFSICGKTSIPKKVIPSSGFQTFADGLWLQIRHVS